MTYEENHPEEGAIAMTVIQLPLTHAPIRLFFHQVIHVKQGRAREYHQARDQRRALREPFARDDGVRHRDVMLEGEEERKEYGHRVECL